MVTVDLLDPKEVSKLKEIIKTLGLDPEKSCMVLLME